MKNIDPRYSHDEIGKGKNPLAHFWRCFFKDFCIIFFGAGSLVLGVIVFPILHLVLWNKVKFKKAAMAFTSLTFRFFVLFMEAGGLIRLKVYGKEKLKKINSCIVIANHPSMLDMVFLISLIKNTDCIVRGNLTKTPLRFVIRQLYIVNTLGAEEMIELSKESLATGTNILIFPEGTRTPRHGLNPYKRGAAHIALQAKSDIIPVYIGGNDKYGLGKNDPFFSFNPYEKHRYNLYVLDKIPIKEFLNEEEQIASRRLTSRMHDVIADAAKKIDGRIL